MYNLNIVDDFRAEKALVLLREKKEETDRIKALCNKMILEYKDKIDSSEFEFEELMKQVKFEMAGYIETVEMKETKTQKKYKLASGEIIKKKASRVIVKTDDLANHVPQEFLSEDVKIKVDWKGYKDTLEIRGDSVVNEDGEIVQGVEIEEKAEELQIKL